MILSSLAASILTAVPLLQATEPPWIGCWQSTDGSGETLWLDGERCGWLREGKPLFYRLSAQGKRVTLEKWGRRTMLELDPKDGRLHVSGGVELVLERRKEIPEELMVEPYDLPADIEVDPDTVAALRDDLLARRAEDQRVRRQAREASSGNGASEMMRVDSDNTAFLLDVIRELGWIDAVRFGPEASDAAFLIVQHASDLRLMRTALPRIEADVKAGRLDGQAYALLFDRCQLNLGYKQRYGSQLGVLPTGERVLMPCEDWSRVDEQRASLGMTPLADYLALYQQSPNDPPVRKLEEALSDAPAAQTR